jgi:hypothetical protein
MNHGESLLTNFGASKIISIRIVLISFILLTRTVPRRRVRVLWTNTPALPRCVVRLPSTENPSHARRIVEKGELAGEPVR